MCKFCFTFLIILKAFFSIKIAFVVSLPYEKLCYTSAISDLILHLDVSEDFTSCIVLLLVHFSIY